jgi:hypothetical protein
MKPYKFTDIHTKDYTIVMAESEEEAKEKLFVDVHSSSKSSIKIWANKKKNDKDFLSELFSKENYAIEEITSTIK